MTVREAAIKARIGQLLALDPQKPVVSNATLTTLAREFAAARVVEDSDVLAERAACVAVMEAHLARLIPLLTEAGLTQDGLTADGRDRLPIELTRHQVAIETVRQGLHREQEGQG